MPLFTSSSNRASRLFVITFTLTLLAGGLGFVIATEFLIRWEVIPHDPNYLYRDLYRNATSPDAAFGDSHVAEGIVGIPGLLNMACGGENLNAIDDKVRYYYATKKPGHVILQAGFHLFASAFAAKNARTVATILKNSDSFLYLTREIHRYELIDYWRIFLSGHDFVPTGRFMPDGARMHHRRFSDIPLAIRQQAARQDVVTTQPTGQIDSGPVATTYRSLISWLRDQGANVCLVTMPVSPEHVAAAAPLPGFDVARTFFTELAASHGIRYVDLFDSGLSSDYFDDSTHLNEEGALRISPLIAERCFGG